MPDTVKFDINGYQREMKELLGEDSQDSIFFKALDFASEFHRDQRRATKEEFISHPAEVAKILAEELQIYDPVVLTAALLHDVVEDSSVTVDDIEDLFGKEVKEVVDACTKLDQMGLDRRSTTYLTHSKLFDRASTRVEVLLVKLADRLHNIRTLKSLPAGKKQRIATETIEVYAPIAEALSIDHLRRELYNRALEYKFPKRAKPIKQIIRALEESKKPREFMEEVKRLLDNQGIPAQVRYRIRELEGYYDPLRKSVSPQYAGYRVSLTVVAKSHEDCYRALGVINSRFPPLPRSIRDFIASPKSNGYSSLHVRTDVEGESYLIKIRTPKMDRFSRLGPLALGTKGVVLSGQFWKDLSEMVNLMGGYPGAGYREVLKSSQAKEILVYTPRGDRIPLPISSVVLDFAFKIHSDLGERCLGAMIRGKRVPPSHVLNDGDRVEILLADEPVTEVDPELEKALKTLKAKALLARKRQRALENFFREMGESLLLQELERYNLTENVLVSEDSRQVMNLLKAKDLNALCLLIGHDKVRARDFVKFYHKLVGPESHPEDGKGAEAEPVDFNIHDVLEPTLFCYKYSSCCHPYPGQDDVVAVLSEKGLSLHARECTELDRWRVADHDRIHIQWEPMAELGGHRARVVVRSDSARDFLASMSRIPQPQLLRGFTRFNRGTGDWEVVLKPKTVGQVKEIMSHLIESGEDAVFSLLPGYGSMDD